jgi:hypothetical protein
MYERPADTQDDAEGHTGREHSRHGGDNSLDCVVWTRGCYYKPEEHVDHVNDPNGSVEVETITKHEFPECNGSDGAGFEGAGEG